MEINYADIGKRIRARRIKMGLSQERLAELADLSVPHMSHIETANTKLSLPVLVSIANVLKTTPDALLCDSLNFSDNSYDNEIQEYIKDCTTAQRRVLAEVVKATVEALRKNIN